MFDRHTSVNIAKDIQEIVDDWQIGVCAIVHDNARNITGSVELYDSQNQDDEWGSIPCAAYTLQFAVKSVFDIPQVQKPVGTCRKIVGHFKHLSVASLALKERNSLILIQDCPTRWNSTYYMLSRLEECRRAVTDVMLDGTVTKSYDRYLLLKTDDWETIESLLPCQKSLEVATTALYVEKGCLCQLSMPLS